MPFPFLFDQSVTLLSDHVSSKRNFFKLIVTIASESNNTHTTENTKRKASNIVFATFNDLPKNMRERKNTKAAANQTVARTRVCLLATVGVFVGHPFRKIPDWRWVEFRSACECVVYCRADPLQ